MSGTLLVVLHTGHGADLSVHQLGAVGGIAALAAGYLLLAGHRRREPRSWSTWRTASFVLGCVLLVAGVIPQFSLFPADDFRGHMNQHLLIGMYAPLGLVLGAPITLLLRSIPRRHGRLVGRVLRSPIMHVVANPGTALLLSLGGLVVLYFTPLYVAATTSQLLHGLVHVHFFLAGYLFAWVIAGPDPAPRRPGVPARLVVLGIAVAGHAIVAQLIYAGWYVQVPVSAAELRGAGDLMYYGGDIAELLLAFALVSTWRPRRRATRPFLRHSLGPIGQKLGVSRGFVQLVARKRARTMSAHLNSVRAHEPDSANTPRIFAAKAAGSAMKPPWSPGKTTGV